jgi:hypothetical protein
MGLRSRIVLLRHPHPETETLLLLLLAFSICDFVCVVLTFLFYLPFFRSKCLFI